MDSNWIIHTHGDPLGAFQNTIKALWERMNLDILVITPIDRKSILESPDELDELNPFRPLMKLNTAQVVVNAARKHPGKHLGALLRPCELRALNELAARGALKREDVITICVDCLGTFPADEFEWRSKRSAKGLTRESLQFAPQGGISAYRFRPACQMCAEPGATEGDINFGVFGLPVRQLILMNVSDLDTDLQDISKDQADENVISMRSQMLAKISERHIRTRERALKSIDHSLPADMSELLDQFEACGGCQTCMDVCPICTTEQPRRDSKNKLVRKDVMNWLLSCAGCGMCEQSCPQHQPLSAIFNHIRDQIEAELNL